MARQSQNNFFGGSLQDFHQRLAKYEEAGGNFKVVSLGMSRKIIFEDSGFTIRFFGSRNRAPKGKKDKKTPHHVVTGMIDGAYFAQMLRRQVDVKLQSFTPPVITHAPDVQSFNLSLIENSIGKTVTGFDMNSCYWTTAYLLGYIDEALYQRGVTSGKKMGLLISVGCLNKRISIVDYKDGKQVGDRRFDEQYYQKYSPVYWHIINHVWELMVKAWIKFGRDNWYMWLTDCLYVDNDVAEEVAQFFTDNGYDFKTNRISFHSYDGKTLRWYDHNKGEIKPIGPGSRDIRNSHSIYVKLRMRKAKRKSK